MSGTLSVYGIDPNGALSVITASVPTSGAAFDVAISRDGRSLYVVNSGSASIDAFAVAADGTVARTATVGVPRGAVGLASL